MCIHFSDFQFAGETGLKSRKWSINRFMGLTVGQWVLRGVGVGGRM